MNSSLKTRLLSSLEKVFPDDCIEDKNSYNEASMLRNERYSFQVVYIETGEEFLSKRMGYYEIKSDIKSSILVRGVELVPSQMPAYSSYDKHYLRTAPGLYPDLLMVVEESQEIALVKNQLRSLWITIELKEEVKAGCHDIEINFYDEHRDILSTETFYLEVIDRHLPKQELIYTQWFHCDCLAVLYHVEVFSERHWHILRNYIKNAVKNGINMILTPVFTPPLDTMVGGERPTVQLVDVFKESPDTYSFHFEKLKRWIDLCHECGIEYFEISHLFTQWGARHAPKIIAKENGEYKRIFGWDTDAASEEYKTFLQAFLSKLTAFLREEKIQQKCYFHISDEPNKDQIEAYSEAKGIVKNSLKEFHIMDALSDYEFYASGVVEKPIPATNHIEPFLENDVPNLWTYYCCGQWEDVSNRFFSMSSQRNRIIATQLYKYNIEGFLQWGYNFWFNQFSKAPINPYQVTDGEWFAPSGDPFSVYPGNNDEPVESLRIVVFYEALQDLRAFKLLESMYTRKFVMEFMEENIEKPITFKEYPRSDEYLLSLREKVNQLIKRGPLQRELNELE